jgi:hypothetical protein
LVGIFGINKSVAERRDSTNTSDEPSEFLRGHSFLLMSKTRLSPFNDSVKMMTAAKEDVML